MSKKPELPSDRSFGFTFTVVFTLLALWQAWAGRPLIAGALGVFAVATLAVSLACASLLAPLNRVWMKFGALLHRIVSPIILGAMYLVLIAPVGIAMRLFGRDALRLRLDPAATTYWVKRDPAGPAPDSLPHQF